MQKPHMWVCPLYQFPIKLYDKAKYTVRSGVLGPEVKRKAFNFSLREWIW